jgi:hypothetical protein
VWYDEPEAISAVAQPQKREIELCDNRSSNADAPLRMTLDGAPVSQADSITEADRQRCVDVTTNKHDIQIQFDRLKTEPALNVVAVPAAVPIGEPVVLATYSNYLHWIRKAEIRFFEPGQDPRERPFLVLPVQAGSAVSWRPDATVPADSYYTLRVYDEKGRFDETTLKPLTIVDRSREEAPAKRFERWQGYGESTLRIRNIPVSGGSVTVSGRNLSDGDRVQALGEDVPIDKQGRFVTRQLLPAGIHSVQVETVAANGERSQYTRNLTIERESWFYVALGEMTASRNSTTGPALLVTQDQDRYDKSTEITGRGALYAKGKMRDDYLMTLSADTRERPIEDLFSNFTSKDPRFLLERIDAERAYPVYGDDSSSEWDAPTNGRF